MYGYVWDAMKALNEIYKCGPIINEDGKLKV